MTDRSLSVRAFVLFVLAIGSAVPALCTETPTEKIVDLRAADGTKLKATYFAAAKPGPGVLLLHQCNRQRKVWDDLAQQLASAGINVLTFDLRGFGESGGDRFDKLPPEEAQKQTAQWPADIDLAFQYLISRPGVARDQIGVGGASCGVNNSVQAARQHPEVKSLALLSGSTDWNGRGFLRDDSRKIPVFFSVADDDEFKPSIVAIEWLYSLTGTSEKRFEHYATGGHGADMFRVHPELEGKLVDWYVTTLIVTPGRAPVSKQTPAVPEEVRVLDQIDQPGGAVNVEKTLEEARQRDSRATLFPEAIVNVMGYEHLQAGDNKGAVEIMKLNAAAYPNSPNVYDSLADAYLADGQKNLAGQNAKKALELLPSDTVDDEARRNGIQTSAEEKLKQLGEAHQ